MNPRNLWKLFLNNNNTPCGDDCNFFYNDGSEVGMTFEDATLLQKRVMVYLFESGWRCETKSAFGEIVKACNMHAHKACDPRYEKYDDLLFSVTNLYPGSPDVALVCDPKTGWRSR